MRWTACYAMYLTENEVFSRNLRSSSWSSLLTQVGDQKLKSVVRLTTAVARDCRRYGYACLHVPIQERLELKRNDSKSTATLIQGANELLRLQVENCWTARFTYVGTTENGYNLDRRRLDSSRCGGASLPRR